jgi:integrase
MTPNSFTWRFKLILKKNGLPTKLNVHDLRHTHTAWADRAQQQIVVKLASEIKNIFREKLL